ncbi:proline--tRNA ligase [Spirochaeta cellobiosiphila]|uniref:proline--tRNA ligase n=1 Tax=Spirochaeta cellobiosiphila TaxID=504483 RepID=UPI000412326F|nr:proline--tRNA ligase [Spirochaeta cellobiosiphila]
MRMSKMVGQRIKETPRDASTASHIYLIRGGYVRPVSAGIYSLLPLAKRITTKIEKIIREEMNKIEGQEVLMPVVLPQELWEESGRAQTVGPELLKFKDRNGKDMLLGMTHEEAICHLTRTELTSYKQLPVMLYQIQTKYRDEARPRAGLIRVREFTMKDGYSFHVNQEDLQQYYTKAHDAYENIYHRMGMPNVVSIESDSGMMGGSISHEFMALADCGEDTLFISPDGSYKANREVAYSKLNYKKEALLPIEKVHTPGTKTIDDLAQFLNIDASDTCKAVFYRDSSGSLVFVNIRGDLEVNEAKLKKALQSPELSFATDEEILAIGAVPGYASLYNIDKSKCRIVLDYSAAESTNLVVGANETDYHLKNFNYTRDSGCSDVAIVTDIATVREGDPCPLTGEPLLLRRGIEVGNIFQLGTKYSEPMKVNYLDQNGKSHPMVMGCYGIGVGRSMASVIEQSHDDYGPIWPMSIAPFQVHICALNIKKDGIREAAEKLYQDLLSKGIEVLYDDRGEKAGFMFNDADLIGVPLRVVISPKTLEENQIEFKTRDGKVNERVSLDDVLTRIVSEIDVRMQELEAIH